MSEKFFPHSSPAHGFSSSACAGKNRRLVAIPIRVFTSQIELISAAPSHLIISHFWNPCMIRNFHDTCADQHSCQQHSGETVGVVDRVRGHISRRPCFDFPFLFRYFKTFVSGSVKTAEAELGKHGPPAPVQVDGSLGIHRFSNS